MSMIDPGHDEQGEQRADGKAGEITSPMANRDGDPRRSQHQRQLRQNPSQAVVIKMAAAAPMGRDMAAALDLPLCCSSLATSTIRSVFADQTD